MTSISLSRSSTTADDVLTVTRANLAEAVAGLPSIAKSAIHLALMLKRGRLDVRLPEGRWVRFDGDEPGPHAVLMLHDWRFARRVVSGGDIGVAESYLAGEWHSPDVTQFLEFFCVNTEALQVLFAGKPTMRLMQWVRHLLNRNTRRQAQKNIHAHYDLGNAFYEAWLDRTMTYSSAIFTPDDSDLASGQIRKYRELARSLDLKPEHHVLEIGCGWGGFATFAATEIGCRVTGLTISREQHDYARARIAAAGLSDRVDIAYRDYRDERGRYDRIASIEMFEAVGERWWPQYFAMLDRCLTQGGRAGLQVITIQERFFAQYRREIDFIRRYIFPGGMLPTPTILRDLGRKNGMPMLAERAFGTDYATTLAVWRRRFWDAWPTLEPLGFDERFKRLWEYYLHYCEAGFRAGNIDVRQMVFAKP